jgi:hypothetical protein
VKAGVYREFRIPDDEEVYEAIGEWPDSDESGARVLTVQDPLDERSGSRDAGFLP